MDLWYCHTNPTPERRTLRKRPSETTSIRTCHCQDNPEKKRSWIQVQHTNELNVSTNELSNGGILSPVRTRGVQPSEIVSRATDETVPTATLPLDPVHQVKSPVDRVLLFLYTNRQQRLFHPFHSSNVRRGAGDRRTAPAGFAYRDGRRSDGPLGGVALVRRDGKVPGVRTAEAALRR